MLSNFNLHDLLHFFVSNNTKNIKPEEEIEVGETDAISEISPAKVVKPSYNWTDLKKEKRTKERGKSKGKRNWTDITALCLHQTAVDFGSNPKRMLNVPAHGGTLQDGHIILLNSPIEYMWHGHSANMFSIGIEISCRAAGIEGNPETFWISKKEKTQKKEYQDLVTEATDIQLQATLELCKYYIDLVSENGGEIKYVIAHRQSHKSRVSDPGSKIWKRIAIPLMKEKNLSLHPVIGSGNPIPTAWDPYQKEVFYNWKIKGY